MSTFDPAEAIAAFEDAGAEIHLLFYGDGTRAWSVVIGRARAADLRALGALSDERADAVLEAIWQQQRPDRIHYGGPTAIVQRDALRRD
jgi:hypothetical protein